MSLVEGRGGFDLRGRAVEEAFGEAGFKMFGFEGGDQREEE